MLKANTTDGNSLSRGVFAALALSLCALFIAASVQFVTAHKDARAEANVASAAAGAQESSTFQSARLEARAAYVEDLTTGAVLFALNPDVQLPLASITKVPLILVTSEVLSPEGTVVIPRSAILRGEGGGLGTGDTWRVQDLIDFTLIASSNAGAEALADASDGALREKYPDAPVGGAAVWRMNELARDLGLSKTYFLNASGLDASATQAGSVSSARDVAVLFTYASRAAPTLFRGSLRNSVALGPQNGRPKQVLNTNEALPDIPGLVMSKTGFTDLAGGNLAIVFDTQEGHRVVAVVLGSSKEGRFTDIKRIVEVVGAMPSER